MRTGNVGMVLIAGIFFCVSSPSIWQSLRGADGKGKFEEGVHQFEMGQIDAALKTFESASLAPPDNVEASGMYASTLLLSNRTSEALVAVRKALKAAPRSALLRAVEAAALFQAGMRKEAEIAITNMTALKAITYWEHLSFANALLNVGKYDQAVSHLTAAIGINGSCLLGFSFRGVAYDRMQRTADALKDHDKAVELGTKSALAYQNRAGSLLALGQLDRAMSDYTKAIALNPKLAAAYGSRGVIYRRKGDTEAALKDYNRAIELDPRLPDAYSNRGYLWRLKNDYAKAIADYRKALELRPENPAVWSALGTAYNLNGQRADACAAWKKSFEQDPNGSMGQLSNRNYLRACP